MDCPICFTLMKNSCIGSCMHHFCLPCLIQWCEHGGRTCPICKTIICEIKQDLEFNQINSPESSDVDSNFYNNAIIVDFSKNSSTGITLENNYICGKRGPGVIITKIDKNKNFYLSGLRKNDVILFINNIPCVGHKQSIIQIDDSVKLNISINCVLLKLNSSNVK